MELHRLVRELSRPGAYPVPPSDLRVIQTHVSVVFLADDRAYKVKKPRDLGFLDFSTRKRRRTACEAEVTLNRRLAPEVYLGVVPVTERPGGLRFGGEGQAVEHAVCMRRLPDEASFASLLATGRLDAAVVRRLGRWIADFHAGARRGPEVTRHAGVAAVAALIEGNLRDGQSIAPDALGPSGWTTLRRLVRSELRRRQPLIAERARAGVPRDGHGDLRLDHCYLLPDRQAPDDLVIVDCIEFSEDLRCLDPVLDVAFLVMDLEAHGRPDLGAAFFDAWAERAGDAEGAALLPLFVAHRHLVRAKVDGLKAAEPEVAGTERTVAAFHATRHLLAALARLAPPVRQPALLLVGGLPGSGKSSLARGLADAAGFEVVGSDTVRKELAGLAPTVGARADLDAGLYTREWTDRTYAECVARARDVLRDGGRVLVDASFGLERRRREVLAVADELGVPGVFLLCQTSDAEAEKRLASRRLDPSDADADVRRHLAARWQEPPPVTAARTVVLDAEGPPAVVLERALAALAARGLAIDGERRDGRPLRATSRRAASQ